VTGGDAFDAAWCLRACCLAGVAALLLGIRTIAPDPDAQRDALLLVALGLGYGHLLGALLFGSWRRRSLLGGLWLGLTLLTLGVACALALASSAGPALLIALTLLATWHIFENELALGRAAAGALHLPPLPRAPWPHLGAVCGALALVLAAVGMSRFAPWLVRAGAPVWLVRWSPEEAIAALLLYHTLVWLGRSLAGTRRAAQVRGRRAAILAIHALPLLALCGADALAPAVYALAASPTLYVFLSAAHAFHTCFERGLEPG
jgi:hypothetical protein